MTVIEKILNFINEKILKKESQKLLTAPSETEENEDETINLNAIYKYLKQDKYTRNLAVSTGKIKQSVKKSLINKIDSQVKGIINTTHDAVPLVEGRISEEYFISVRRKNVPLNKVGQTIISESGYVDISTRKKSKENKYLNLSYKEYRKTPYFEELFEIDVEDERYSKTIKNGNVTYLEQALYASEEDVAFIEDNAQPSDDKRTIDEYERITKLKYISRDEQNNIWNALKVNPYFVRIEAKKYDKNGNIVARKAINKIFKSKKECIVGYRPEMVFLEETNGSNEKYRMYRLLPEGLYADNSSFKQNFEGKYAIKKVSLEEIESLVKEIPFSLSEENKKLLRNGYDVPNHIKKIYEVGLMQIHALGLDRMQRNNEE